MGWEKLREQIFANQKRLGVIPANTQLTPWPDDLPKWDSLSLVQKKLYAREAEVFAGYAAYTDHEIGRVIQAVEDMGKLDNTLIIYISGDNGTSAEGTLEGTFNQMTAYNGILTLPEAVQMLHYEAWGSDTTYPHMSVAWSWAFDTPFKWTKQVASHFGGTRQGMVISWPGHIKDVGGIRTQFHHMIDIVPTILEATGIQAPDMVNGIKQKPIEGVSMAYTFDKANANAPSKRDTQYFEMFANRGIYHDGWYACTTPPAPPWLHGNEPSCPTSTTTSGNSTTSRRTTRNTTTSRPRIPTSSRNCRRCSWRRRRNTRSCRWITRSCRACLRRGQARPPGKRSSPTRVRMPAFPSAMLPAS